MTDNTEIPEPPQEQVKSQATELVELGQELYRLGVTEAGEPYAVHVDGGPALMFRGGRSSLGAALAREFFKRRGRACTAAARADALTVLEGMAADLDPIEPALRVGRDDRDRLVVDLAGSDGWVVRIGPQGYEVLDHSPILFRRTALTLPLPCPVDDMDMADLAILRDSINVPEQDWRLLVGFMVAALIPEIPHPIMALFGPQGSGKSSAARLLVSVLDPASAPLRSDPRNEEQWAMSAAGSLVVALDNISSIRPWLSDALCRAVTGDGWLRRTLYSNSDVSVLTFRRVVIMTSIDAGAMRGDLAERLLPIELERIDTDHRRTEGDIDARFEANHARIIGGLYGVTAQVLNVLPSIRLDSMPRLADFARVLAALDEVTGWATLESFEGVGNQLADDVIEADPVATEIVALADAKGSWTGTAGELLKLLTTDALSKSKDWPGSPQAMAGALKRAATALRAVGVNVEHGDTRSTRRTWYITRAENRCETSSTSSTSSKPAPTKASEVDDLLDDMDNPISTMSTMSTTSSTPHPSNTNGMDDMDDLDDQSQLISAGDTCPDCGGPPGSLGGRCFACRTKPFDETEVSP